MQEVKNQYSTDIYILVHVNLTIRVNPNKWENQRAKLERYFLEWVS